MSIVRLLKSREHLHYHTGATEEQIKEAEKQLNVSFSREYKEYLKSFGEASCDGHELTGIYEHTRLDVIRVTLEKRAQYLIDMSSFYVVEETNIDSITIWQNQEGIVYAGQPTGNMKKIFDSLSDYIERT